MDSYRIEWKPSTKKDLRKLPPEIVIRVAAAVSELSANPRPPGSQKLAGSDHTHRLRLGDYRMVYSVQETLRLVTVLRVRHRRDVYRD